MKTTLSIYLAFFFCLNAIFAEKLKRPILATTIDFLDYVFFDKEGGESFYPLEIYEKRIKSISETGIKKLYLRVNVRGLTIYPSKLTYQYGQHERWHWQSPDEASRLIATLKKYDPCLETIRLGHKYGMEVWAWESVFEDGGVPKFVPKDKRYLPLAKKCHFDAMTEPFFLKNPDCFVMRDPKLSLPDDKVANINQNNRGRLIKKIVLIDHVKRKNKIRFTAKDIAIEVSDDNQHFLPYNKPFYFTSSRTSDGFNTVTIDNLQIKSSYVVLKFKKRFDTMGRNVSMGSSKLNRRKQHKVYDEKGKLIYTVWTIDMQSGKGTQMPLSFVSSSAEGWDMGSRRMGFCVGEVTTDKYWYGIVELTVPKAMKHKVAKFKELSNYKFDGFMLNLRTHCYVPDPMNYGYNPEVRKKFLNLYGKDIWKNNVDLKLLHDLRAESLANFFHKCKQLTSGRPLYISGLPPQNWKYQQKNSPISLSMYRRVMHLPIPYKKIFKDGSIDGVIMVGTDFSYYFTPELTGGKHIKLGVFRDTEHLLSNPPRNYNFISDICKILASKLDEVELYETIALTKRPNLLKKITELSSKNK
jgi:hypothetical protein